MQLPPVPPVTRRPEAAYAGHAFALLGFAEPLVRAVADEGYTIPTPIQERATPSVLAGRDLLGRAETGTGKTAAFVLPMLQRLDATARTGVIRALVLAPTKHGADRLDDPLARVGVTAAVIRGNKSQGARERALDGFRNGTPSVLVATDIAARANDVDGVSHVFNHDLPDVAESYVHRIGRTGRAGARGATISFCGPDERGLLTAIERLLGRRIEVERNSYVEPQREQTAEGAAARRSPAGQGSEERGAQARQGEQTANNFPWRGSGHRGNRPRAAADS